MKELTLNVNIQKQDKGAWVLRATPQDMDVEPLATYCIGQSKSEVLGRFYTLMSNKNIKYWFLLENN